MPSYISQFSDANQISNRFRDIAKSNFVNVLVNFYTFLDKKKEKKMYY